MLRHSIVNLLLIRACILLLTYTPVICALVLAVLVVLPRFTRVARDTPAAYYVTLYVVAGLLTVEILFFVTLYLPHKRRHKLAAQYPAPLTPAERGRLLDRCLANVPDVERYLRLWFLGAEAEDIRRENVREFMLWAFFDREADFSAELDGEDAGVLHAEMEQYLDETERALGQKLGAGRGKAKCLRLTIDAVDTQYHSVLWYAIVALVDFVTHVLLRRYGFVYYAPPLKKTMSVVPPRLQFVPSAPLLRRTGQHRSVSSELGYWFREHTAKDKLPVVFIHGIGIGLWPYTDFIGEINKDAAAGGRGAESQDAEDGGQIGVLVLEILPMSMRLTSPVLPREEFLSHLTSILAAHGEEWREFVLVSHSYGSVLTTHILRDADLGPRVQGVVLIDPVSVLLHLPDVAYNFTRRTPRYANEWQLWYFASMDLGVAEGLGRHFFWRENEIWKEELLERKGGSGLPLEGAVPSRTGMRRNVAVSLSGRDLIVDTPTLARYLVSPRDFVDMTAEDDERLEGFLEQQGHPMAPSGNGSAERGPGPYQTASGLELLWFPGLDHAQVFDKKADRRRVLDVVRRFAVR